MQYCTQFYDTIQRNRRCEADTSPSFHFPVCLAAGCYTILLHFQGHIAAKNQHTQDISHRTWNACCLGAVNYCIIPETLSYQNQVLQMTSEICEVNCSGRQALEQWIASGTMESFLKLAKIQSQCRERSLSKDCWDSGERWLQPPRAGWTGSGSSQTLAWIPLHAAEEMWRTETELPQNHASLWMSGCGEDQSLSPVLDGTRDNTSVRCH